MEITEPNADPASSWYVTSGLLPIELMTGRVQVGYDAFAERRDSYINAAGDPFSFPSYPQLQPLYQNPGKLDPATIGQPVTSMFNPDGSLSQFATFASVLVEGLNNHAVPRAFVDFQNQQGIVYKDGRFVREQVYDPLFVFGLPVTPAVWVNTTIGGKQQPVLLQVFERHVLTYNPANPPAFRVEMGNVGQHYHQFRYQPENVTPLEQWNWDSRIVRSLNNPNHQYIMEVDWREQASVPPGKAGPRPRQFITYRIYFSPDNGATRELRYTGEEFGGCYNVNAALIQPSKAPAGMEHLALATQCADNPSMARGAGIIISTSYDGGRTFLFRRSY